MVISKGKFKLFDFSGLAEWLNNQAVYRVIKHIQVHHTWCPSYSDFRGNNHFELLCGMENAHIERGFAEIEQHFTTFPDGTIASGRPIEKIPAGIKGANLYAICIENVGNFDVQRDIMTPLQKSAIIQTNALLCKKFGLQSNTDSIIYHHWFDLTTGNRTNGTGNTKSCPGGNFFGGNKVQDAENCFIPLVNQALLNIIGIQPATEGNILFSGRVTADVLNVRDRASKAGKIVKRLNKGVMVNVYEICDNWYKIHPSEANWLSGKYLQKV